MLECSPEVGWLNESAASVVDRALLEVPGQLATPSQQSVIAHCQERVLRVPGLDPVATEEPPAEPARDRVPVGLKLVDPVGRPLINDALRAALTGDCCREEDGRL